MCTYIVRNWKCKCVHYELKEECQVQKQGELCLIEDEEVPETQNMRCPKHKTGQVSIFLNKIKKLKK